ncbi:hypothetical protein [Methylococcus mesophilus]|uniref:hypothetical protein n=1 Tax=Methylococcus mesophilus TaxID=2993564 RepID=UPI00224AD697|nr:hypothetical protein [Methylococcus mesophilus]UZR29043.1 hypothetical protein OOT43_00015 [Methylococcus mesophilus]
MNQGTKRREKSITAAQAYEAICKLAREHALICQAAGGVVVVVHPDTQREEGLYPSIQYAHGRGERPPSTIPPEALEITPEQAGRVLEKAVDQAMALMPRDEYRAMFVPICHANPGATLQELVTLMENTVRGRILDGLGVAPEVAS